MIPENCPLGRIDGWTGQRLSRPECVLTHSSGLILTPDWSENGGISLISPGGMTRRIQSRYSHSLRPNGIALEKNGTVLMAHLGDVDGGIFRLHSNGETEPVVKTVDGIAMPPANFVVQDSDGRVWITVSTRKTPRSADYRAGANTGFIAVAESGESDARIVADGLGYTNECVIDEARGHVWVNETFGRKLTRFHLKNTGRIELVDEKCICRFGAGTYPDGLALDEEGFLWVTSIVSNRILRVSPNGKVQTMFEDSDQRNLSLTEEAYQRDTLGREHLDKAHSEIMQNISNLAFGGPERRRMYIGNLLGDRLPFFDTEFTGVAMAHWNVALGDLQRFVQEPTS